MPILYFVPGREADTFRVPLTAERLLRSLEATGRLAGFCCIVYMIERIQGNPEQLQLITKRFYGGTGKKLGVSAASIECNLRALIHFCWNRTDHSFPAHITGMDLGTPPINSEFLDMLVSYLRETGGWREGRH